VKRALAIGFIIGFMAVLTGCGVATHQSAPDPTAGNVVNGDRTAVIQMPNGYRNVSFTCFRGNGIYVTSSAIDKSVSSSITVLAHDPLCV
jgi:hypothetical protein